MSLFQTFDSICFQRMRQKKLLYKKTFSFLYKEDLWIFVKEKNKCLYNSQLCFDLTIFKSRVNIKNCSIFYNKYNYQTKQLLYEVVFVIYDFFYKPFSYSFDLRKNENFNSHIILEQIGKRWNTVQWIFQADCQNCLELSKFLKSLLQKQIHDVLLVNFLILLIDNEKKNTSKFLFQLSITRFQLLLSNICLFEFDTLFFWIQHESKKIELQFILSLIWMDKSKKLFVKKSTNFHHLVTKVFYVRYVESWMIGTNGPISFVKSLFLKVYQFFKERLRFKFTFNLAQVTNINVKSVNFVGYKFVKNKHFHLQFELPMKRMLTSLNLGGFLDKSGQPMPKKEWALEEDGLIVSTFNYVILAIRDYWGPASNQNILRQIEHILYVSCAKTLAHKHRTTASQIFVRYGKSLSTNCSWNTQVKIDLERIKKVSWIQSRNHLIRSQFF
uniref:putative maturase n=1 Tax=Interfilum massjukiae TaxID=519236 RepID=UPI00286A1B5F|nr:putative maturase [Interfilum massjukiae]WKT06066.1 putative maturase [Interfilum massjukiae]